MSREAIKLAIIGGGSSYTPELVEGVIKRLEYLPVKKIHFVDIESGAEKLEIIKGLAQRMVDKAGAKIEIKAGFDRRAAIKDADFVMTQFRVGGLAARANDERIPIKYDVIGQETTALVVLLKHCEPFRSFLISVKTLKSWLQTHGCSISPTSGFSFRSGQ